MAKITNFTNFSGTINGLIYYTANGQQFVRVHAKKRNNTKSKKIPANFLAITNTIKVIKAFDSMDHLMNALKKEFKTLENPKRHLGKNRSVTKKFNNVCSGTQKERTPDFEEHESAEADFQMENTKYPRLENAVRENTNIKFTIAGTREETELYIIVLQINFATGKFHREKIPLAEAHCIRKNTYTIETKYQPKKGYTNLLFLYGQYFLKTVPIICK